MRENRFARAMGLGDDCLSHVQRHNQDESLLNGPGKNLNSISTVLGLLAHALGALPACFHVGNADVVGFEKSPRINRRSTFGPKGLAHSENLRSLYFAAF